MSAIGLAVKQIADNDNAHLIEQNQRHGEQSLRDNIRRGRDNSGDDEGNQDNVALEFHQEPGADEAHISQQRENHRHVEGEAEGDDEHEQKVQIAFHGDERIDLACGKAEKKFQAARKDEAVRK